MNAHIAALYAVAVFVHVHRLSATHIVAGSSKFKVCSDKHQLGRSGGDNAPAAASSSSSSSAASLVSQGLVLFALSLSCYSSSQPPCFLAAGKSHSLMVDAEGKLHAWGLGVRGACAGICAISHKFTHRSFVRTVDRNA